MIKVKIVCPKCKYVFEPELNYEPPKWFWCFKCKKFFRSGCKD